MKIYKCPKCGHSLKREHLFTDVSLLVTLSCPECKLGLHCGTKYWDELEKWCDSWLEVISEEK